MIYIEKYFNNGNLVYWILVNVVAILFFYGISIIVIRKISMCNQEAKKCENPREINKYLKEVASKRVNGPDYFLNRVVKIIASCSVVYFVVGLYEFLSQFLGVNNKFFSLFSGILLIALIVVGIWGNNKLDSFADELFLCEEKECNSSIRLLGSIIVLLESVCILLFTELEYKNLVCLTLLTLVLGRFIYFDTSRSTIKSEWDKFKSFYLEIISVASIKLVFFVSGFYLHIFSNYNLFFLLILSGIIFGVLTIVFKVFNEWFDFINVHW